MDLDFSSKYIRKEDLDNMAFQIFYNLPNCYKHFCHLGILNVSENQIEINDIEKYSVKYKRIVRQIKSIKGTVSSWKKDYETNVHFDLSEILDDIQDCDGNAERIFFLFKGFLDYLKKNDNQMNYINQKNTIKHIFNKAHPAIKHKDKFTVFAKKFNNEYLKFRCVGSSASLSFYETDKNNIIKVLNPKAKVSLVYEPELVWVLHYGCKVKNKKEKTVKKQIYSTICLDEMLTNVSSVINNKHVKEKYV